MESYTFPIRRILPNGLLENLVINEHTDGKYYAKLLKYKLTLQERIDLENGVLLGLQNPIITEKLGEFEFENQIQSNDCGSITITVITACRNGHTSRYDCSLRGSEAPQIKTITVPIDCVGDPFSGGGGGDGSGGYFGNPFTGCVSTAGGGGGGGYITPAFPNDLTPSEIYENGISEPVLDTDYQGKPLYLFYVNLTEQQQQWLNDQTPETQQNIADYLNLNDVSEESQEFSVQLIDELANININSYPGKEDLFPFEWWNDDALIDQYLQGPYESWRKLSIEEKRLTKSFPTIAYKLYKNKDIAFQKTFQYFGNVPQVLNGKPDAFRHAFFQAINTVTIRKFYTELFANAHESEVPTILQLEKEMDLFNNEIGMNLIEFTHPSWSNTNQIATEILNMLNNGELIYLKPINYSSPNFWDNLSTSVPNDGNHGINNNTQLTPTNH